MRIRNITRTVVINHVTATVYNRSTKEVAEKNYDIIGDYEAKDVESLLRKDIKAEGFSLVDYETEKEEVIRSMTEEMFFNLSETITRGKVE